MQEAMNSIKKYINENYVLRKDLKKIIDEEKEIFFSMERDIGLHRLYVKLKKLSEGKED